ncbi:dickkopf-related protein 1-like [Takifugu flavidus]|uniref:Dickkopf-related protein 1 n=1 Tax=Takifugu flavidus TaxID=433684 RepID=A0A5C6PGY4_9TELE|nr:dickkopf-related protein 1-like [Takifugu flavidus]TWW78605.1 Dickkopf-related protein 1 [Takifugu flavidus]
MCRKDGYFRTVGLSLKFHPSAFVVHSEGREDKQVHMYKEIIPGPRVSRLRKHRSKATLWKLRDSGYKADLDLVAFVASQKGFLFLPTLFSTQRTFNMQLPTAHRFFAVYLTLFGYVGEVYAGTVPMNSNAIKNLPADFASKVVDTVSPSPRTSPPGGTGHKSVDALQSSGVCTVDGDCGGDEFCNDAKGACLPCRKSRKRCARDSMCCAGNRCSNGVCQANDIDGADAHISTGWHRHNNTKEHHTKKPPPAQGNQPNAMKGMEGDTCLRSADCSEGLCCARHFWSRICKPVLTEGQVCTRHRRKGTHGLELFQRCDCGEGMTCRPERGERDHSVSRTAARNLHTCQRR